MSSAEIRPFGALTNYVLGGGGMQAEIQIHQELELGTSLSITKNFTPYYRACESCPQTIVILETLCHDLSIRCLTTKVRRKRENFERTATMK